MKKLLLFIGTLFCLNYSYGQIAYYDAQTLKTLMNTAQKFDTTAGQKAAIKAILKKYAPNVPDAAVFSVFNDNPFFKPLFVSGSSTASVTASFQAAESNFNWANTANAIGNTDVTNLADGAAKFLIKRGKEELFIAVIDKLKDTTQFPEVKILFPKTWMIMNNFDSWEYANVLNTLKGAFDQDLQQLLGTVPNLATQLHPDDPKYKYSSDAKKRAQAIVTFLQTPQARVYLSAMLIGNGVISNQKLPDVIHTIAGNGYLGDMPNVSSDETNAIKLFDILSYSVESNSLGVNYISAADFGDLLNDDIQAQLYLGLLYQQLENQHITIHGLVINKLFTLANYGNIKLYINNILTQTDGLTTAINSLITAKKQGDKDLSGEWSTIFQSTSQFLQKATAINVINPGLSFPPTIQNVIKISIGTLTVAQDIAAKNYSGAVVGVATFLPDQSTSDFKSFFIKYGSFAANIVQAQNSDDAENAIEAVALPSGSYSVKQNASWNISVNGYIGYGFDFNTVGLTDGYANGIYAPIGFSLSKGIGAFFPASVTLFASVFDLGGLVSYRLNNGTTNTLNQQVTLESIISPSAQLFFEFHKFPVAFGGGWRMSPKLTYANNSITTVVPSVSVFNLSVLIDIPIFTLHNTGRK